MSVEIRAALKQARRVVVKVGSRALTEGDGRFAALATQLAQQRAADRQLLLVSSGAIALGRERLGLEQRPRTIARLQASAAAGQSLLMHAWEQALEPFGVGAAQVLLTHADLANRERFLRARAAFDALLELGALPIVNENDTVAVDEIRFGDNDQLAAMVATLVGADLLILLSDVPGLMDADGAVVASVHDPDQVLDLVRPSEGDLGRGGMASKLEAARRASMRGVPVVLAGAAEQDVLARVLEGEPLGTLFLPAGAKLPSRKHWIAYTLEPRGALLVDTGAAAALKLGGKSLLPAGVVGVRGDFEAGDAVSVLDLSGAELARGLSRYATPEVARFAGQQTREGDARTGQLAIGEIIHRDDLVLI
ncbi:MAG: glutamate 5-kinase [Deltaproteobacteria bacterium]|nr:glutamate 5-kinase [Deltaproteobacteria bacterium]